MKCPQCGFDVQANQKCPMCGLYIPGDDYVDLADEVFSKPLVNNLPKPGPGQSPGEGSAGKTLASPPPPRPRGIETPRGAPSLHEAKDFQGAEESPDPEKILESEQKKVKKKASPAEIAVLTVLFLMLFATLGNLYWQGYFAKVIHPTGKIVSPMDKSVTATKVLVSGVTKNVIRGHYIWLAVDKDKYHQCWPKAPISTPNEMFSVNIWEGGPLEEPYTLSLYVVDKRINDRWLAWLDKKEYNGLPMPSSQQRLDSVTLIKGR